MTSPIHPDDLFNTLSEEYTAFSDEKHRVIELSKFHDIFFYKYGDGICSGWTFWVEDDHLVCKNISGFRYTFPLLTTKNKLKTN